ncbi:phage recombination protein Bet [Acetobacter senegalensis]|uniref:phage recombination protein Bet n=1 Tax=Acetobacter senegalensis TaxID=446692 RepID=UPI001EDBD75F|nr:phage recombination protein Bet [Acetobacter senegalensis]MCG4254224.1 phage recombination protein Bet [Acetobacter senegalensis]
MSNAIELHQEKERELIHILKDSLYPGAADDSVRMVIGYCRAASLDVMKKPVHIVPMWDSKAKMMRDVVMPGIALYRIEASRTGEYIGKSEPEFGPLITTELGGVRVRFPEWCRMTVRRLVHGRECEFTAKEYWLENYATAKKDTDAPNAMWKKRAFGQLAKCAEAQALRMAFPEQTGGTNTDDEMEGKVLGPVVDVTPEARSIPSPPAQRELTEEERHERYVTLYTSKANACTNTECCDGLWKAWDVNIDKAREMGKPIPSKTVDAVRNIISERTEAFREEAYTNAPVDEVPA